MITRWNQVSDIFSEYIHNCVCQWYKMYYSYLRKIRNKSKSYCLNSHIRDLLFNVKGVGGGGGYVFWWKYFFCQQILIDIFFCLWHGQTQIFWKHFMHELPPIFLKKKKNTQHPPPPPFKLNGWSITITIISFVCVQKMQCYNCFEKWEP